MSRHRLGELAELVGGTVQGDPDRIVTGLATLDGAGPEHLSFVTQPGYRRKALASDAGVLLVGPKLAGLERNLLIVDDPHHSLSRLLDLFYPEPARPRGIDPTARIDPEAEIADDAWVGPYAVVGAGTRVEAGALINAHTVLGRGCRVGAESVLHPHVVLYDGVEIGERCVLHSGVVLGSDGFGFATHEGRHVKLRHAGRLVVEDEVEIGSNSSVDRALLDETRIGGGTKIDNLVQVGHNVRIGKGCLLVAQAGIAGSTRLGDGVVLAGQAGLSGHLELGDGVRVAAKSAVFKSVEAGSTVAGIPARAVGEWRREQALLGRLADLRRRLRALEEKLGIGTGDDGDEL